MALQKPSYRERMTWFHDARFGMFIHWGLYSILGRGEWAMLEERIPTSEYAKLAGRFNPKKFDAFAWAELAVQAGMKYAVLTTRHHDGFCLFDSEVSNFTSVKTAAKRDFVAEYVDAFRRAGLKVGFYYSLLDWRYSGYWDTRKYRESAEAMVEQYHAQVRELMSNYGAIDVLWYDGHWIDGVKNLARFWRAREINEWVRKKQPHILINNRSGTNEDLDTPEQHVTASKPGRGWESCMTIGDPVGWGYIRNNPNMKTETQLLQHLVTAAAGEGNFLLNVGPKPDGTVRKRERQRLKALGKWLRINGQAIYGSQRCALKNGMIGLWTAQGRTAYLHIFRWPGREAVIPLVGSKVKSATLLATGQSVEVRTEYNGRLVLAGLPKKPPHPSVSVVKVEFATKPKCLQERDAAAWLEGDAG